MVCKKNLTLSSENIVLCRKFPTQTLQVKKKCRKFPAQALEVTVKCHRNFLLHICQITEHFSSLLHLLIHLDKVLYTIINHYSFFYLLYAPPQMCGCGKMTRLGCSNLEGKQQHWSRIFPSLLVLPIEEWQ